MKKHAALIVAGLALTLTLGGCASTSTSAAPTKTPSASAAAASDEECVICDPDGAIPQADEADSSGSAAPSSFFFGATATFEDGVTVSISAPTPYTPQGTDVAGVDFPQSVTSTVTINNASSDAISEPAFIAQATSGGQAASTVFDEGNVNDAPGTAILAGQTLTYPIAFSVADPTNLTVTYTVDWNNHADVTFSTDF
ncbi:hypothetical protein [Curtobacterium sp. 9128]|uniref:hypothetical protein n=1 Tax=Curtobacterium sp. 9128 TaxID=1793722 RepID=UPI002481DECB|nr:hypothetical protein [Curtobacterium sp. 9128]